MREEELVRRNDIALALDAVEPVAECLECYISCNPVSEVSYPILLSPACLYSSAQAWALTCHTGLRAES